MFFFFGIFSAQIVVTFVNINLSNYVFIPLKAQSNIDFSLQAQPMTSEGGKSSSSGFSQLITRGAKCQQNLFWLEEVINFVGFF